MTFMFGDIALTSAASSAAEALCHEHGLTRHQLMIKWEHWALKTSNAAAIPSVQDLKNLSEHLRSKLDRKSATPVHKRTPAAITEALFYTPQPQPTTFNIDDFFSYVDEPESKAVLDTDAHILNPPPVKLEPVKQIKQELKPTIVDDDDIQMAGAHVLRPDHAPLDTDATPDNDYINRDNSGRIEATFNSAPDLENNKIARLRVAVKTISTLDTESTFRYMNDSVPDRIETMRAHLRTTADAIFQRIKANAEEGHVIEPKPESFYARSSDVVMVAGRIRVELDGSEGAASGRINPNSVILESEDGNIVKLDLSRLMDDKKPLFLHPGMVVLAEGINTNGRVLQVHTLYDNALPVHDDSKNSLSNTHDEDEIMPNVGEDPSVTAMFAAGPYTTSKNLNFEPLDDFLAVVERACPNVVFMCGPFLHSEHPQVSATLSVPFEGIFAGRIVAKIRNTLAQMPADRRTHFILLPALEDVHHTFVCPQPPFSLSDEFGEHQNITLLGNPGVVELSSGNGKYKTTVGITSLPSLLDMSADCLCCNKGDRFSAIASAMLRQRSFYPIFPATEKVPLDASLLDGVQIPHLEGASTVDILVMPSKLKAFAKSVDAGAVAINPGLLCRGSYGGTYAETRIPLHQVDTQRSLNLNADKLCASIVRL